MNTIKQTNFYWADYPRNKTFNELFTEQVARTPHNTAVSYNNEFLSFTELNKRSNQLANYIRKVYFEIHGSPLSANSLIPICIDRSLEMVIAILAVMKAGAAYVPIDPTYPKNKIKSILDEIKCPFILTSNCVDHDKFCFNNLLSIFLDDIDTRSLLDQECSKNLIGIAKSTDLSYVIFTSGTTGRPKGVMIRHCSLVNRLIWMKRAYGFTENDKILHKTSFTFDVSVWELLLPLLVGAQLVIAIPDGHKDIFYLTDIIKSREITRIHFVPSMLQVFLNSIDDKLEHLRTVKSVFCSGEILTQKLSCLFKSLFPEIELHNLYGPTEATIDVTHYDNIKGNETIIPIGKPIDNTSIYIADENLNLLPTETVGDLYIGGDAIALGYLNQPELTNQKFINNPFISQQDIDHSRNLLIYKTGDLARWLPDGNIEYIGRDDLQIKIHGLRVELEEIEYHLSQHPSIQQAVITVYNDEYLDKKLVAYFVPLLESNSIESKQSKKSLVEAWREIYNSIYDLKEKDNLHTNFDIAGWNSSYTKLAIPKEEMHEWVDETVKRISQFNKNVILEIGCGTGLLMHSLLDQCQFYVASDFSQNIISRLSNQISDGKVQFICCAADQIGSHLAHCPAPDFIIFNSVIQCFPTLEYLQYVINQTINLITNKGCIFFGDVRDYRLLEIFHASVQKFQNLSEDNSNIKKLSQFFSLQEKELLIAPSFFLNLTHTNNKIVHVDILPKMGKYPNEMNKYRYDVTIYVSNNRQNITVHDEDIQVYNNVATKYELIALLKNSKNFIIKKYPRKNIFSDIMFYESLNHRLVNEITLNEILSQDELLELAASYSYNIKMMINPEKNSFSYYSLVFIRGSDNQLHFTSDIFKNMSDLDCQFSNHPAFYQLIDVKMLKSYLANVLPSYMIPTYFIALPAFPLMESGKINKSALPNPKIFSQTIEKIELPDNELEVQLSEIWQEALKINNIGVNDNFFSIGGNSLSAIIVTHKINSVLGFSMRVNDLFTCQTIKSLCQYLLSYEHTNYDYNLALYNIKPDVEKQYFPFPLTDVQQDYVNEKMSLSRRGIHATQRYVEFLFDFIDIKRLEIAINKIIQRHFSLRTIVQNNMQVVLKDVDHYVVVFNDFSCLPEEQQDLRLKIIRDELSQRTFHLEYYPLFDIRVTKLTQHYILHFCMDGFFRDGFSTGILFKELIMLYENHNAKLPTLEISFRDYVFGLNALKESHIYQNDKNYWVQILPKLPYYPQLPLRTSILNIHSLRYVNDTRRLPPGIWSAIEKKALMFRVSPTTVILCVFGISLYHFCQEQQFLIGLTLFNRLPLHPNVNNLIGNFTTYEPVHFKFLPNLSFRELVQNTHIELWENLNHRLFNGVEITNALKKIHQSNNEDSIVPIVFTSGLSIVSTSTGNLFNENFKGRIYQQRHNSKIWFSNQIYTQNGELISVWDYLDELYDKTMMTSMHNLYCEWIKWLATHDWNDGISTNKI